MFGIDDLLLMSLMGGGAGALLNRKNPLKGALLGAGVGAGLGAMGSSGGLLGLGNTASGPLGNLGTAVKYGTGLGSEQTAMLAAQEAGMGGGLDTITGLVKPVGTALNVAQSVSPQDNPAPPPQSPPMQHIPLDLSSLLQHSRELQDFDAQDQLRRRQLMQQYASMIGRA